MFDERNEIISAGKLNEMLETKRKNEEELKEKMAIQYITKVAFTMRDSYGMPDKDDNKEESQFYSKIAEKMGFLLSEKGGIIRFGYTRPGSTAAGIMKEVKLLKSDIIEYVNKGIKDWMVKNPDNKDDDLYISQTVNLDKFLSKFKVGKLDLFSYSFDWLEKMLKDAGYKPKIFYQGTRDDELIYDVTLTWEWDKEKK